MSIEDAIECAKKTSKKYNPRELVPFPFQKILDEHSELDIQEDQGGVLEKNKVSGFIVSREEDGKGKRYIIVINGKQTKNRKYFTLAHEIGHFILHKDQIAQKPFVDFETSLHSEGALYRDGNTERELEKEANNFAAELIMPEDSVRRAWKGLKNSAACARIFEVSEVAMTIRLSRLGLIDD